MKIAILGSGVVGRALGTGYQRHGHDVRIGTSRPDADLDGLTAASFTNAAAWAELAVLAVKGDAAVSLAGQLADALAGKVVIDATNPLEFSTGAPGLFVGWQDSLGEQIQRAMPAARVVKAYNTVGNTLMVDPQLAGGPPTMLIGGDDDEAKAVVTSLLRSTGWEVADLGGISASRYLEPLCLAWVSFGMSRGSWGHAFKLLGADLPQPE